MSRYRIVWEDESKAREVEIYVEYTATAGCVRVDAIRPTKVTFYDRESKAAVRSINIHTTTGQRLLTRDYLASRAADPTLEAEILSQLELRDEALVQPAA